ncbi:MAG: ISKra4 family transposase [Planctomycetota bacterium]
MNEAEFLQDCAARYRACRHERTKHMNLEQLEELILQGQIELGQKLLQSRLEEDPRRKPEGECACPRCGRSLRIQKESQRRNLRTLLGAVLYWRAYGVCDACGYSGAPLDEALGIPRRGPSVGALRKICHAAVVVDSFKDAQEMLRSLAGIIFGRQRVRTLAEREGQRMVKERAAEIESVKARGGEMECEAKPDLLVIAADGGRVQMRTPKLEDVDEKPRPPAADEQPKPEDVDKKPKSPTPDEQPEPEDRKKKGRWRENRVGVVYDAQPQEEPDAEPEKYEGAKAHIKTFVATMENWETFGWMLWVEALRRGYAFACEVVFLADGAKHIRDLKNLHFPTAQFILDWYHAVEHLGDCAKAAFGEGTKAAKNSYKKWKQMLWGGEVETIIEQLQKLSREAGAPEKGDPEGSPRKVLHQNAYSFFPNNKDAMDYPLYRSRGWPIGSGVAEGGVKQFAKRLKGSEKFWNLSNTGAEEMLGLCALHKSEDGRWDRYWSRRAAGGLDR